MERQSHCALSDTRAKIDPSRTACRAAPLARGGRNRWAAVVAIVAFIACAAHAATPRYTANFAVEFDPDAGLAHAAIAISPDTGRVSKLDMLMPAARYRNVSGSGSVARSGERIVWEVPKAGGELKYDVVIDHKRADGAYDARMTPEWVIVRGDELFPPAKIRSTRDSESSSRLAIKLPKGWTDRESGYRLASDGRFIVVNPSYSFDRPVGWIAAGDLFTRSESIGSIDYRVTGPKGQGLIVSRF